MNKEINTCKECKSDYFTKKSKKENLCPNCAHYLYGQKECKHEMKRGKCYKCHWDGTFSERITALIERNDKKFKNINISIIVTTVILIISLPLTIIGLIYFDSTVLSLTKYSFSRNVLFFLSVFGVLVSIPFLIKAKAYKKRLRKEIPYLN
ncbi:hypothetical protein [Kordia sp.]|uniref:hypothetical protein n=1 Tax=Kordia sp. TaxID=1965332 RepID=UPI003D6BD895